MMKEFGRHLRQTGELWVRVAIACSSVLGTANGGEPGPENDPPGIEYFERHIRPVLVTQCYDCHSGGVAANQTGLRVDIALGLVMGGGSGPSIVKGKPEESRLIALLKYDGVVRMPPGGKLDDETIRHFEEWIRMGAPDPRIEQIDASAASREIDWKTEGAHWSFQPVKRGEVPAVKDEQWPRSDIDRFLLAKLEAVEITPASDAEPAVWLRRVTFDLTGIPPTAGELLDFELDPSPEARRRVVDRLLDSPRFGERWGRHWLDVARFGETTGKERNYVYLQAWRYRDYVIDAFNQDKPFDQFLREQVAGDLLPAKDEEERNRNLIATGFLALNPKGLNDRNRESFLVDIVDEQIESIGRGVLGLSIVCARCHDHKFDPISQADYFALGGIFRSTEPMFGMLSRTRFASEPDELLPLAAGPLTRGESFPHELVAQLRQKDDEHQRKSADLARLKEKFATVPPIPTVQAVIAAAEVAAKEGGGRRRRRGGNNAEEEEKKSEPKNDEERAIAELETAVRSLTREVGELRTKVAAITTKTAAIGVRDRREVADMAIRIRGVVDRHGPVVPRGIPTVLRTASTPSIDPTRSGRLELAQWLTSPENPLTARVYVNRIWSKLLGAGIVPTVDDFGFQGEAPSHPELLDFLASEFVREGWSTKRLIRQIVLSRVYGVGLASEAAAIAKDGANKWLGRWTRRRLEAEVIRDAILAIGGDLDLTRPYGTPLVEIGTREFGGRAGDSVVNGPHRIRSVYLPSMRGRLHDFLVVFDAANPSLTVGKRQVSAGPDQALFLLNSPFAMDEAQNLAWRILRAPVANDDARVDLAFQLALGASPNTEQRGTALASIREFEALYRDQARRDAPQPETAGGEGNSKVLPDPRLAAWASFSQSLLALPQFRYLD